MPFAFTPHRLRPTLALAAALLLWTGCDSSEPNFETPDFDRVNENVVPAFDRGGNQVGEISLTRLFAEPTQQELDAALASVSGRDHGVYDYELVASAPTALGTMYVVSHTVRAAAGTTFPTHYGAIHVPNGPDGQPRENLPVVVYNHGDDNGVEAARPFVVFELVNLDGSPNPNVDPTVAGFVASTVMVIPSFRSEELRTVGLPGLGQAYTSTGSPSPWDYDVDDALTLLNVALQEFDDATDEERIGTVGLSRGAAVSMLMAARDERVDVVTEFFGPTDFLEDTFLILTQALLGGEAGSTGQQAQTTALGLPGADFILDELLLPLSQAGPNQIAYARARQAVLFRSAAYYTERMPNLQVHHHVQDPIVFYPQAEALEAQALAQPNMGAFDYNEYTNALPANVSSFHRPAALLTGPEVAAPAIPATAAFHFQYLIGN